MSSSRPTRVLYMEDDAGAARLFQRKLERLGYDIHLAQDGQAGLSMYDSATYDVLIVDQRMPMYDGIEVIRILAGRGPLIPTIMITGAGNEAVAVEAMKLGAGDYMVKDMDGGYLELLPTVIDQLMQRQRLIEEKERHNRNIAKLNEVGQALTATLNSEQVIEQLLRAAVELANAEAASAWIRDDLGTLTCEAMFTHGQYQAKPGLTLEDGKSIIGRAAEKAESLHLPDGGSEDYSQISVHPGLNVSSQLVVPLSAHDVVMGVLEVTNKRDGLFTDGDQVLVGTLAASAAVAIDNARLVEALQQHASDLQSRNEELDAFSHMVAHDLKNPLSLTIGYAQFLRKRRGTQSDEDVYRCLEQIEQSGVKMGNIIDELLLFAKIRSAEVEVGPLDMADIVAMAELRLTVMIKDYGAQISWPDVWPAALGHDAWIEEIWVNYLSNAMKYGGRPPCVQLGATVLDNGMAKFWARDNGEGLTPEDQAKLFTPFTRLSQIRVEGHGLGLSIVRRIVEKLGGEVGIESEVGKGSTFSFTLPMAAS